MIEAVNSSSDKNPLLLQKLAAATATGVGGAQNDQAAQRVVKEVVTLLNSDSNMRLTTARQKADAPGSQVTVTGSPELDEPDSPWNRNQDLERLLIYLQLDTDENLSKMAQVRLQSQRGLLDVKHEEMRAQIEKNQAEIKKALKAEKFMNIFGWVLFGISAAVTLVTGGAAFGAMGAAKATADLAVKAAAKVMVKRAIQTAVGFALQVAFTILGETGVMEKGIKAMAKSIQSHGKLDEAESEACSTAIFAVLQLAAIIAGTWGSGAVAGRRLGIGTVDPAAVRNGLNLMQTVDMEGHAFKSALRQINRLFASDLMKNAMVGFSLFATGAVSAGQLVATVFAQDSNKSEVDTKQMDATLARIQQMMDETVEELQLLLSQVEDHLSRMASVVNSAYETEEGIAQRIGQMA